MIKGFAQVFHFSQEIMIDHECLKKSRFCTSQFVFYLNFAGKSSFHVKL